MYKCIIFDVDGTLIDTDKAFLYSLQKLLKIETGQDYNEEELAFSLGIPGAEVLRCFNLSDCEKKVERWIELYKDYRGNVAVYPGMKALLQQLHSFPLCMGIVTSRIRALLEDDLHLFGLKDYFQYTICADDTEKHKPEPEPLWKLIELTGNNPADTLYIGDSIYDMQCAQRAGVDFALALWGAKTIEGLGPKYKLTCPKDIINIAK